MSGRSQAGAAPRREQDVGRDLSLRGERALWNGDDGALRGSPPPFHTVAFGRMMILKICLSAWLNVLISVWRGIGIDMAFSIIFPLM